MPNYVNLQVHLYLTVKTWINGMKCYIQITWESTLN
jgi:hypothetical protein